MEDVEACVANLNRGDADLCLTVKMADRNPYFTMVSLDADGRMSMLIEPPKPIFRRQDAPEVYDIVPVAYAANAAYILRTSRILEGRVRATIVPAGRSVDIDTEQDFAWAEFLLSRQEAGIWV